MKRSNVLILLFVLQYVVSFFAPEIGLNTVTGRVTYSQLNDMHRAVELAGNKQILKHVFPISRVCAPHQAMLQLDSLDVP